MSKDEHPIIAELREALVGADYDEMDEAVMLARRKAMEEGPEVVAALVKFLRAAAVAQNEHAEALLGFKDARARGMTAEEIVAEHARALAEAQDAASLRLANVRAGGQVHVLPEEERDVVRAELMRALSTQAAELERLMRIASMQAAEADRDATALRALHAAVVAHTAAGNEVFPTVQ